LAFLASSVEKILVLARFRPPPSFGFSPLEPPALSPPSLPPSFPYLSPTPLSTFLSMIFSITPSKAEKFVPLLPMSKTRLLNNQRVRTQSSRRSDRTKPMATNPMKENGEGAWWR